MKSGVVIRYALTQFKTFLSTPYHLRVAGCNYVLAFRIPAKIQTQESAPLGKMKIYGFWWEVLSVQSSLYGRFFAQPTARVKILSCKSG